MSLLRRLIYLTVFLLVSLPLAAQKSEPADSLVRLMSAQSGQLIEKDGVNYRKIIGPARFLHNDTYLICDTALWNVNLNIIHAIGNVKILQEETVLSGDKLDYYVDEDLAQFRGLVQLEDKDRNMLRTHFLDYNTQDSVAVFQNGASMKDKDGQIIESRSGTYDSKIKLFTFTDNVNMFSDSTFIKTNRLTYNTDTGLATFTTATDAWNSDKMLSSGGGWYDRSREVFFFRNNVHMMSEAQEGWADSLYYYRNLGDLDVRGHVQIVDTTRNVAAFGGKLYYRDTTSTVMMTRDAAIMIRQKNEDQIDTTWVGADTLIYKSIMMCDLDSLEVVKAEARLKDIDSDPIYEYRKASAEKAAKAKADAWAISPENPDNAMIPRDVLESASAEQIENLREQYSMIAKPAAADANDSSGPPKPNNRKTKKDKNKSDDPVVPDEPDDDSDADKKVEEEKTEEALPEDEAIAPAVDSTGIALPEVDLSQVADSLSATGMAADSLAASLAPVVVKDTTKIDFAYALSNVKIFRKDMQAACDSLAYNGLDSLARFYKNPLIWNEQNRQYSADSIAVMIKDQHLDKARLMSDAFITIQETDELFDQIQATEMMAYFDTTGALGRFDALGGALAMFYLEENDTFATVNKVDCKMFSAVFADGTIDRIYYYETVKNDGYPVVQLPRAERELKGFSWQVDKRPAGKEDITSMAFRPTERSSYENRPRPVYQYTDIYFPGYMKGVQEKIRKGEIARQNRKAASDSTSSVVGEPVTDEMIASVDKIDEVTPADEIKADDSEKNAVQKTDKLVVEDTPAPTDSVSAVVETPAVDPAAIKKQQKAEAKALKEAQREARWAELDAKDAARAEAKKEKAQQRKRMQTLKKLKKMDKTAERDEKVLQRYQRRYERKKARLIKSGKALESTVIVSPEEEFVPNYDDPFIQQTA